MITLSINHPFAYEMECVVRIFYPGEKVEVRRAQDSFPAELPGSVIAWITTLDTGARLYAKVLLEDFEQWEVRELAEADSQTLERELGAMLYRLLSHKTGRTPPWGILTGVRPVRLCNAMLSEGMDEEGVGERLEREYLVHREKAELALRTGRAERAVLERCDPKGYSLYISIPFCPSRCLYCSFVSHDIEKAARLVPEYLDCLGRELAAVATTANELGLHLQSVYIGGGTPTTLTPEQLEQLLECVQRQFDLSGLLEYTAEAGRPDTITAEKLAVLRKWGVDRISVNPQTMNDELLAAIGRKHTAAQTRESYAQARAAGFRSINMDLIAGLPGETPDSFTDTLEQVLALGPENITVHTLTVKRSSALRDTDGAYAPSPLDLSALLDDCGRRLAEKGYHPYYLYRQKGTVQNLENVGYARPGFESFYNVLIMEEVHTVLAAGAGATTKLFAPPDSLRRVYNYKFPYEYISRFDEMLARKRSIKEFYEEH